MLNPNTHNITKEFIRQSMILYRKITRPSRVITHSATLIDNIVTNDIENNTVSGLSLSDIRGHLIDFVIYDNNYRYKRPEQTTEYKGIGSNEPRNTLKLALTQVGHSV